MEFITAFIGRLHPLLVHLPIGILFLAFVFECLSARKEYKRLQKAVSPALLWGSAFTIAAGISGYFLRQEGGYEEGLADLHQNLGIGTAVFSLCVYVVRKRLKYWMPRRARRKKARILLFVPLLILVCLTGHFGGSLTHGADYLFAPMSNTSETARDPAAQIRLISNVPDAILYTDVIRPILEARCYSCHSASKKKGDLRLDQVEFIERGGEDGPVISAGPADSSALFHRITLPIEDDDHMPPREKPQMSSSEIALIKYWLEEGAHFEKNIGAFRNATRIAAVVETMQEPPAVSWIPEEPVATADEKALERLRSLDVRPTLLADGSAYLSVSLIGHKNITADQINALQGIKDQLVWLNLGHSNLSDADLAALSPLKNLRVLYLNHTDVSDDGLAQMANLANLRHLSLVGTHVSDASIPIFEKFPHLDKLFLFETSLTPEGVAGLMQRNPDLAVDTGHYTLQVLATDTIVHTLATEN